MDKNRLEAFSDGVIAIIITIMVLELKIPHNPTWQSYLDAYPVFISYAISFIFVGLYWSTHHHLFQTVSKVDNKVLWLNMLTLFWLSLIPFATASMGENLFASVPVTVYAIILILVPASNILLINALCRVHGPNSELYKKYKGDKKSYITLSLNVVSAIIAFVGFPKIAFVLITLTALMWFLPNHGFGRNHHQKNKMQ
jgi:uncharacterized membrane protein